MSRRIRTVFCVLMLLAIQVANAAEDYLECNLPNGDQFILINKYDYSPMAKFIRHAASRVNQFGFNAYYKPKGDKTYKETAGNFRKVDISLESERKKVCSNFFSVGNKAQSSTYIFNIINGETNREELSYPDYKFIDELDAQAKKQGLYTLRHSTPYHIKDAENIQIEYPLTMSPSLTTANIVDAVISVETTDNGQTWSAPIITKDAKLFEISKSILDQPAVAKPGKWKKGPG